MAARGKIARLPHEIREQLNRRLRNGEKGRRLMEWLNSLPEVQRVLAAEFAGEPIVKQNLSRYRLRGYREWLNQQEALEEVRRLVKESVEFGQALPSKLSDRFASFLLSRYVLAIPRLRQKGTEEEWRLLRELCQDLVALRKGDQEAEWLRLEQDRLELRRGNQSNQSNQSANQ
jgi:Protein of unknown function (DUF3486)